MKKVAAFVGSARKRHTYDAVCRFLDKLAVSGDVEGEIIMLSDYRIEACRGCKMCFEQGEAACPLADDRDALIEKMLQADGVVFASPSYVFQVSGTTKTFIDRIAFYCHRPRFFGKSFTSIVTQGLSFDTKILKYLSLVGSALGFKSVPGTRITALEPMTERESHRVDELLKKHSGRFRASLFGPPHPPPSMLMLMGFRIGRSMMKLELDDRSYDYRYYKERGWFDSDYFYPTRLGLVKKVLGRVFDVIGTKTARKR